MVYFLSFSPEPTHAPSSLDSRISPATRPTGFALFSGSTPRRPSHDAPQSLLCRPCALHHAHVLTAPRPRHAAQPRRFRKSPVERTPGAQDRDSLAAPAARAPLPADPALRIRDSMAKPYAALLRLLLHPLSAPPLPTLLPHVVVSHL